MKFVRERTKQSGTVETFDLLSVASNNSLTVLFPVAIVSHSKLRGILTSYAIAYVNLENCLYQVTETVLGVHLASSFTGITSALGTVHWCARILLRAVI